MGFLQLVVEGARRLHQLHELFLVDRLVAVLVKVLEVALDLVLLDARLLERHRELLDRQRAAAEGEERAGPKVAEGEEREGPKVKGGKGGRSRSGEGRVHGLEGLEGRSALAWRGHALETRRASHLLSLS